MVAPVSMVVCSYNDAGVRIVVGRAYMRCVCTHTHQVWVVRRGGNELNAAGTPPPIGGAPTGGVVCACDAIFL